MLSAAFDSLNFMDLYVRLDQPDQAYFKSKEREHSHINQLVPPEYQAVVDRFMVAASQKLQDHNEGAITFDNVRCRLSRLKLSDGSQWACARRINTIIPDIEKLNLPTFVVEHMMGLGRRDGLIVISGATGQGKTTTAVALLAHYLRTYGGTALTIEDPCEFTLSGRHGKGGQCFQVEVEREEDWAVSLKRSLRWAPRYIFVGEVRTPRAAEQLLRAASTGHMVITTVHSGTIEEALMGIIFLAEQSMGSSAYNMLASGLTALVNQSLGDSKVSLRYIYTEENSPGDPVRALIREGKIGMLSTYIDRVAARLQMASASQNKTPGDRKS